MGGRTHKLFFAIFPPPPTRASLVALQASLKVRARPIRADRLHLTLLYLGPQSSSAIEPLVRVAAEQTLPSGRLEFDRLGSFGRAQVGWAGCTEVSAAFLVFRQRLADALALDGFTFDPKPWAVHVTLYREMRMPLEILLPEPVIWPVEVFSLVDTVSDSRGVQYVPVASWRASD